MRKHLIGGVALIALCAGGHAIAADMPVKAARVAPAPLFTWTGCYLGVHAGYGWGRADFADPSGFNNFAPPGEQVRVDTRGGLGGGQVGCNYQIASNWVVGAEADFSAADIKGSAADPFFDGKNFSVRTNWLSTATARVGFTMDRTMFYAKGGGAWARDRYDTSAPFNIPGGPRTAFATINEARAGWTMGFGVEHAIWDNWSVKIEYDHYDFGTRRVTFIDPGFSNNPTDADVRQRIDTVKAGINFRFGGPVSARY